MSRVIKVKDKKDESSERPIKVGDLLTYNSHTNQCVFLVTKLCADGMTEVLIIRNMNGRILKNPVITRGRLNGFALYRGKVTIKQE